MAPMLGKQAVHFILLYWELLFPGIVMLVGVLGIG